MTGIYQSLPILYPDLSWDQARDEREDIAFHAARIESARYFLTRIDDSLARYAAYCSASGLQPDIGAIDAIGDIRALYARRLGKLDIPCNAQERQLFESAIRALHLLRIAGARSAAWVCGAYDHSSCAQIFNAASFNTAINYDRYESGRVREIENDLKKIVSPGAGSDMLVTSSGMAAYHMADAYLRQHVLKPGDTVLVAHGLYSEVSESMLKGFQGHIVTAELYDAKAIVDRLEETGARVLYADPMKNRLSMRLCDINAVIELWQARHPDRALTLVVDGTMTTGSDRPFDAAASNIEILYYSSCCKYLQLGQDSVSAGFLAFPAAKKETFLDIRRATGAILYDTDAWAYPDVGSDVFNWRMDRLTRNALAVGAIVNDKETLSGSVKAVYPGLPDHEDFALSRGLKACGNLLAFRFNDALRISHGDLNGFVKNFLQRAKREDIDIVNGESFGFATPRLYVGWTPSNVFPPFLRLSAGARSLSETAKLAFALRGAMQDFVSAPARPAIAVPKNG